MAVVCGESRLTSPSAKFAEAEAWAFEGEPLSGSDGFDFRSYSRSVRPVVHPGPSIVAMPPEAAPEGYAGVVGAPVDPRRMIDRAILQTLCERAMARLAAGESPAWALTLDVGRDRLLADLRAVGMLPEPDGPDDHRRQRDRVGKARTRLIRSGALERLGQLRRHVRDGRVLDGALVVHLNVAVLVDGEITPCLTEAGSGAQTHAVPPTYGDNGEGAQGQGCECCSGADLVVFHAGHWRCCSCLVVGTPVRRSPRQALSTESADRVARRASGALSWAVLTSYPGNRNNTGFRLACTLREIGLNRRQTERYLSRYARAVTTPGSSYTGSEARASTRSAYRQSSRRPV